MTRRRVTLSLVLLLAAFAVAVQRDTFIRRWLVPAPPKRPLLDREIAEIRFSCMTYEQAISQLSAAANVHIEYYALPRGPAGASLQWPTPPFDRTFRQATVERILYAIIEHWRREIFFGGMLSEHDGAIHISPYWPGRRVYLVAYDVTDLVTPGVPPATLPNGHWSPGINDPPIGAMLNDAARVGSAVYLSGPGNIGTGSGVWQVGSRYLVLADEACHRRIAAMLAELRENAEFRKRATREDKERAVE